MTKANYDVYGNREDRYRIKREGASRISAFADTKSEAEQIAKDFCRKHGGGEVRIHRPDGRIMDSDTIPKGNDPCPPRDRVM